MSGAEDIHNRPFSVPQAATFFIPTTANNQSLHLRIEMPTQ